MSIHADFIAIQRELPPLIKDTEAHGYKYPTLTQLLDIVLPMCHARGLGLMQVTHPVSGGGVGVETILFNAENEKISGGILAMPLTTDDDGNIINVGKVTKDGRVSGQYGAQAYGSALTYARRYSLTAFFGMKAEDDDGYRASQPKRPAFNLAGSIESLRHSPNFDALKENFGSAWRQAPEADKPKLKEVYDELKRVFEDLAKGRDE